MLGITSAEWASKEKKKKAHREVVEVGRDHPNSRCTPSGEGACGQGGESSAVASKARNKATLSHFFQESGRYRAIAKHEARAFEENRAATGR